MTHNWTDGLFGRLIDWVSEWVREWKIDKLIGRATLEYPSSPQLPLLGCIHDFQFHLTLRNVCIWISDLRKAADHFCSVLSYWRSNKVGCWDHHAVCLVSASHHFTFETVCWFSRYLFYICRHWRTPQHRTFNFLWWVISAREMLEIMGREWQYRSVYLGCESSALRVKFSTHNTTCCHIASFNIGISNEILIKVILARN